MKTALSILFSLFITFSWSNNPATTGEPINPATSRVTWKGYKVLGSHEGKINISGGNLEFAEGVLTGGEITIDMNSITCTDLEGGTADKLVGHLNSDDFFGVANHPTASLKITKVASRGKAGEYKVTGDLTIKGITKSIKFDTTIADNTATSNLKIDRSEFNIQYGSGSFFDNLGDKTIYDEFDLDIILTF